MSVRQGYLLDTWWLILQGAGSAAQRMSVRGCGQHSYPVYSSRMSLPPLLLCGFCSHFFKCSHCFSFSNFVTNMFISLCDCEEASTWVSWMPRAQRWRRRRAASPPSAPARRPGSPSFRQSRASVMVFFLGSGSYRYLTSFCTDPDFFSGSGSYIKRLPVRVRIFFVSWSYIKRLLYGIWIPYFSVADPDPGSGMSKKPRSGPGIRIRDEYPGSYFRELRRNFLG